MSDTRYITSVGCTWHGPIEEVGTSNGETFSSSFGDRWRQRYIFKRGASASLPCCPHCGAMLTENATRADFEAGAEKFCVDHMGGDRAYLAWLQSLHDSGTCRPLKDWDWRADFEAWKANRK